LSGVVVVVLVPAPPVTFGSSGVIVVLVPAPPVSCVGVPVPVTSEDPVVPVPIEPEPPVASWVLGCVDKPEPVPWVGAVVPEPLVEPCDVVPIAPVPSIPPGCDAGDGATASVFEPPGCVTRASPELSEPVDVCPVVTPPEPPTPVPVSSPLVVPSEPSVPLPPVPSCTCAGMGS